MARSTRLRSAVKPTPSTLQPSILSLPDLDAWTQWLATHHASRPEGVWLALAKKNTPGPSLVRYDGALEAALCHGWIDGQRRTAAQPPCPTPTLLDPSAYFLQRFTPRRPRSLWSARNVSLVTQLIAAGRMQPAGQAEVERARADGRWQSAYPGAAALLGPARSGSVDTGADVGQADDAAAAAAAATTAERGGAEDRGDPETDLLAALALPENSGARQVWEKQFSRSQKYVWMVHVASARTASAKKRKVQRYLAMLEKQATVG